MEINEVSSRVTEVVKALMSNVVVIGLGNIGTRHVQALQNYSEEFRIYGVETYQEALKRAEENLYFVQLIDSINKLPELIDLCVIATPSGPRREIFEHLVNHSRVRNVLFEKVLFQRNKDYEEVAETLKEKKINAWVNCVRRENRCYIDLKKRFKDEKWKHYFVTGGEWGLCCNGIHMVDLIQYLSDNEEVIFSPSVLIPGIYDSKRLGYKEMYGTINGTCGEDILFQISCTKDVTTPMMLVLSSDNVQLVIEEGKKKIHIARREENWKWVTTSFQTDYQSQLTGRVAKSILDKGVCNLPTYEEAINTHKSYIEMWLKEFRLQGWESDICPIT